MVTKSLLLLILCFVTLLTFPPLFYVVWLNQMGGQELHELGCGQSGWGSTRMS